MFSSSIILFAVDVTFKASRMVSTILIVSAHVGIAMVNFSLVSDKTSSKTFTKLDNREL